MNPPPQIEVAGEIRPKARIAWGSIFAYALMLALGLLALVPLISALI